MGRSLFLCKQGIRVVFEFFYPFAHRFRCTRDKRIEVPFWDQVFALALDTNAYSLKYSSRTNFVSSKL
jgi:hypothetical protein